MQKAALTLPIAALLALGCEGLIHGSGGRAGGSAARSPADDEMQSKNPGLHETAVNYFPGTTPKAPKKRVFRLTRTQLDLTTKILLPAHQVATARAVLPRDPLQTNYEYAANLTFNAANFTPLTNLVTQIIASVRAKPESVIDCAATNNAAPCLTEQAEKFVKRAFRGVVSPEQLTHFSSFFVASVAEVGFANATADLVDMTLSSPNYLFRDEVQTDAAGLLLPAQLLQSLTYTLADAPPEGVGLSSTAPDTYVRSASEVDKTIDTVLATPEARSKLLGFFKAWLEVKEPEEFTIATSVFPEFTPDLTLAMLKETDDFLNHQLSVAAPKLKDLTQSTQSFVSDALATLYDVKNASGSNITQLDPTQRLGIFTQPAVLASHSGPTTTRLVKRGVFFTRKVMCLPLGSPPPGTDTTIPTTTGVTERQRIETVTQPAKCAGCHAFINPFGFMLENYDAIGRFRTKDEGLPIDASISVDFLDEGALTTNTAVDALKGFTKSLLFQQCFARQLFRFYMGRDETEGDDPILRQMFFEFANNDSQDIIAMLKVLATSPGFSQRGETP